MKILLITRKLNIKKNIKTFLLIFLNLAIFLFFCTALYAQEPKFIWANQANFTGVQGGASSIAIDSFGNSIITGSFEGLAYFGTIALTSVGGRDIFIAKYDAVGNVLWAKQAGGTSYDDGSDVAIDRYDNIIVTGRFEYTATFETITLTSIDHGDMFIAKYDAAGNIRWAKSAGGSRGAQGSAIAIDEIGNSFVTGRFGGTATFGAIALIADGGQSGIDIFIAKYDESGNVLWAKRAGGTNYDHGHGIAVDNLSNVVVTGQFYESANFDATMLVSAGENDVFIAKYNALGNLLWAKRAGGPNFDSGSCIATDGLNNIVVAGYFYDTANFDKIELLSAGSRDAFIAKYDSFGNVLWVESAGGTGIDDLRDVFSDMFGCIVTTGYFTDSASFGAIVLSSIGDTDIFIANYDNLGTVRWVKQVSGTEIAFGNGIAVNTKGSKIITGSFFGTITFDTISLTAANGGDIFIAQLNEAFIKINQPNGGEIWEKGTQQQINWHSLNVDENVKIELSRDGGINWETIIISTENNNNHLWIVSGPSSNNCKIKITSTLNSIILGQSDNNFSIVDPLEVNFDATPLVGIRPLTIKFNDSSAGDITNWFWDFGNGESSTQQNPTHTYQDTGHYTVTLNVTNLVQSSTIIKNNFICVYDSILVDFYAEPRSGTTPLTVQFYNKSSGQISTYFWSFGDYQSSTDTNPIHVYKNPGTYSVGLAATSPEKIFFELKEDYISCFSKIYVTIPETSASTGATVQVPINVGNLTGEGVISYEFTLTYSASVLNATGASVEETLTANWGMPIVILNYPGLIKVGGFSIMSVLVGGGPLVKVIFDVIGNPGDSSILDFSYFEFNGGVPACETFSSTIYVTNPASVKDTEKCNIRDFYLGQNFPNPFNPTTTIKIGIAQPENVSLKIYNVIGQDIRTIYQDQYLEAGYKTISWNGLDDLGCIVPSGIYIYRLVAGDKTISNKMLLIR